MRVSALSLGLLSTLFWFGSLRAVAQSVEISAPSPITTNELVGRIAPRDIGDARFTDHFYSFVGNPGDLIVTIESRNLNGDVDVFTAVGLRPLLKFTVYAESSTPIAKSIFLRRREELILRVEARSPNDDDGIYRITFGGSFEAMPRSLTAESDTEKREPEIASAPPRTGRRVSSSGARINEPAPPPQEVAAVPTPEPTPEPTPATKEGTTETVEPAEKEAASPSRSTSRRTTGRRSRSRPPATETKPATETETETTATEKKPEETTAPPSNRRSSSRRTPRREPEQPPESVDEVGPRLVIETTDGTLINKSMTAVRRVMVENGWVIVVGKDGVVQRILLSQVVRMLIAP